MIGQSISSAPISGSVTPTGVQRYAVRADFPAAYAILAATAPTKTAVRADFLAAYAILSDITMQFERSKVRTLDVLPGGPVPFAATVTGFWDMTNPKKPKGPKDPNAVIDISFDWNKFLADCGDSIAAHSFEVGGALINKGSSIAGGIITVFLGGGEGTTATVNCKVVTASTPPREEDRTITLSLEER